MALSAQLLLALWTSICQILAKNIGQLNSICHQFLDWNKKNIKIIDDFFADNTVRSKHFRDNLDIYIARAIDEIFDTDIFDVLRQKLFPDEIVPQTEEQLDELLAETNSSYTEAVNDCVRVFRNGLSDGSEEELEILESKLLSAREMLDKNVGVIEHELTRRKKVENKK